MLALAVIVRPSCADTCPDSGLVAFTIQHLIDDVGRGGAFAIADISCWEADCDLFMGVSPVAWRATFTRVHALPTRPRDQAKPSRRLQDCPPVRALQLPSGLTLPPRTRRVVWQARAYLRSSNRRQALVD